jgi:TolB-like protein
MIMKKLWLIACATLFFTLLPICATARDAVSRLSVFNFNAANLDASKYGPDVTNMFTDALGKNKAFSIISRHELLEFLRLNDLQQNSDLGNMVNIGSRLGLNFIVTGRIEKKGMILVIECMVVNVQYEKAIFTRKVQVSGDSNLEMEVNKLSDSIAVAIAPQSSVAPQPATAPQSAVAQTTFAAESTGFDGRWAVSIICDDTRDKQGLVKGWTASFFVDVKNGKLTGKKGQIGQPAFLTLVGDIAPDGTVQISANGLTSNPAQTIGHVQPSTPYAFRMRGKFTKTSGNATRIEHRPCQATFIKQ